MQIQDLMSRDVVSVSPYESVFTAAKLMSRTNVGALPVTEDGRLEGMLTDRDITLRCVAVGEDPREITVRSVMSRSVVSVAPGEDTRRASELMSRAQVRRLPVVEGGRLVGMLSLADLARRTACDMEASRALTDISANLKKL